MAAFEEFGVMPELIKAVEELEWSLPTPIQAEAIPLVLGGGDVLAAAETGSGKTGAFALPVIQIAHELLTQATEKPSGDASAIRLSPDDRDTYVTIDATGTRVQSRNEAQWGGVRATIGVTKGKYCFEVTVMDEGVPRVGWATKAGRLELGTDAHSFGYGGTGKKSHNRTFTDYGDAYTKGDVIRCEIDLSSDTAAAISFSRNGKSLGKAFDLPKNFKGYAWYPAVTLKNAELQVDFSPQAADGYQPIASAAIDHTTLAGSGGSKAGRQPVVLIIEPSRELAEQTHAAIQSFTKYLPLPRVEQLLVTGGVPIQPQLEALNRGVDIVTGTPGRLIELVEKGRLTMSHIRFLVLDEADRFLEPDANVIIMKLYALMSPAKRPQVLLFSATLHSAEFKAFAEKITKFATWVDLKGKDTVPESVHHVFLTADPNTDHMYLLQKTKIDTDGVHAKDNVTLSSDAKLTTREQISEGIKVQKGEMLKRVIDAYKMDQAMIFVRTKLDADNLETYFQRLSKSSSKSGILAEYSCAVLHSDRSQNERKHALQQFKDAEVRFLICTDVAARGIDVSQLPYVVNYTLPDKPENYIHRVGRVGRADKVGLAVSLVGCAEEKVWFHGQHCKNKNHCKNTALLDQGGCTIWYNEPELWKSICTAIGKNVKAFDPADVEKRHLYGQKKTDEAAPPVLYAKPWKETVAQLQALDTQAQRTYWDIRVGLSKKTK